jgi:hypothetical protein
LYIFVWKASGEKDKSVWGISINLGLEPFVGTHEDVEGFLASQVKTLKSKRLKLLDTSLYALKALGYGDLG